MVLLGAWHWLMYGMGGLKYSICLCTVVVEVQYWFMYGSG